MMELYFPSAWGNTRDGAADNDAAKFDALDAPQLVTAVPCGGRWKIKAIGASGSIALLGSFGGRLPALGAAVLLAQRWGARVTP